MQNQLLLRATSMQLQPTFLSDVPKEIVVVWKVNKFFGGNAFLERLGCCTHILMDI